MKIKLFIFLTFYILLSSCVGTSSSGVFGTGHISQLLVWGPIIPGQNPNWTGINDSQSPSWTAVSDSQTPEWEEVA